LERTIADYKVQAYNRKFNFARPRPDVKGGETVKASTEAVSLQAEIKRASDSRWAAWNEVHAAWLAKNSEGEQKGKAKEEKFEDEERFLEILSGDPSLDVTYSGVWSLRETGGGAARIALRALWWVRNVRQRIVSTQRYQKRVMPLREGRFVTQQAVGQFSRGGTTGSEARDLTSIIGEFLTGEKPGLEEKKGAKKG
jgi:hypothetical protein